MTDFDPELDCVVVYLPAKKTFPPGRATKLPANRSNSMGVKLAGCRCRLLPD
jgi:hypothetical protein